MDGTRFDSRTRSLTDHAQQLLTRFNIILTNEVTLEAVVLCSTPDANKASIALHQQRTRLIHDGVVGELLLMRHDGETATLLREPLRTEAVPHGPVRRHQARVITVPTPARDDNRRI